MQKLLIHIKRLKIVYSVLLKIGIPISYLIFFTTLIIVIKIIIFLIASMIGIEIIIVLIIVQVWVIVVYIIIFVSRKFILKLLFIL